MDCQHSEKHAKVRQAFTLQEDAILRQLVQQLGDNNWVTIAQFMPNRNARQCRDRWRGYLRPTLNSSSWSEEEDRILIQKFKEIGPRWSMIGKSIPGRSEISIKSRWRILTHYCTDNPVITSDHGLTCDPKMEAARVLPMAVYFKKKKTTQQEGTRLETCNLPCNLASFPRLGIGKLETFFNSLKLSSLPNGPLALGEFVNK